MDQVYCIYYNDGEMTISQKEIEPEAGRTVVKKGVYNSPESCTRQMTTVRFIGAVKPKSCGYWFLNCENLTEIKNIENLYTDECTSMCNMFYSCNRLTSLDLSGWNTEKVTNMSRMFGNCYHLISINLSGWNIEKVSNMQGMFDFCEELQSITAAQSVKNKIVNSDYNTDVPSDVTWTIV